MVRRFNPSIRGALKVVPGRWYSTAPVCDFTYCYGGDWAMGKVGQYSLGFGEGTNDPAEGVVVSHHSDITFGDSDDFSVACWAKSKDATAGLSGYVTKMVSGGGWTLGRWAGDYFVFSLRDGGHQECLSDVAYQDTDWHHLVGTRNGTTKLATLYVDGIAQADTTTVAINDSGADLVIGRWYQDSTAYHADAYIDEVGIWNVVLSSTEITALYNNGFGARTDSVTPPGGGELRLYYDFEIGPSGSGVSSSIPQKNFPTSTAIYDVVDASFHGSTAHTGTMTNMSVADFGSWGQGKLGKYSFIADGADDEIRIASSSYFPLGYGTDSFSISFWANNNEVLTQYPTIVGRHTDTGEAWNDGYNIQWNTAGVADTMRFSVGEYHNVGNHANVPWDREVHLAFRHVVATYNKDTNVSQLWLDGVKGTDGVKSTGSPGPMPGTGPTRIGVLATNANYSWPGKIDEMAFYNVVLTDGAIGELYNSGLGARANTVSSSALVCYLDMECNGPGSTIVKDLSGNDLSGTLTSADPGTCG